jgi:hypothetical protein
LAAEECPIIFTSGRLLIYEVENSDSLNELTKRLSLG